MNPDSKNDKKVTGIVTEFHDRKQGCSGVGDLARNPFRDKKFLKKVFLSIW